MISIVRKLALADIAVGIGHQIKQSYVAVAEKSTHCGLFNPFAKICWKKTEPKQKTSKNSGNNNLEHTEFSVELNINCKNYHEQFDSHYKSSGDNYAALIEDFGLNEIAPHYMNIAIVNIYFTVLLDSRSGCSIINLSLAKQMMYNCEDAK